MQQRKSSASGRPSGTDGSDFSYRMVVDSRYTKVAKGKSRLSALIITRTGRHSIDRSVVHIFINIKGGSQYTCYFICLCLFIFSFYRGIRLLAEPFVSLLSWSVILRSLNNRSLSSAEGRKRSRVNFLRVFMVASSMAILISVFSVVKTNSALEVIKNPIDWETKKFELLEIAHVLLGLLVQIFLVSTIISLIGNMSPPKKAS